MPIHVDLDQRRSTIAEATLRVAARHGIRGVTIRSVATELDASTTFITNYLPTRSALLINALQQIEQEWLAELEHELVGADPAVGLRRAMQSAVAWDAEELLRCQFWVAVLAVPNRDADVDRHLFESTSAVREVFAKLADQCGHRDPETAADLLMLVAQGGFVSIVETPELWDPARLSAAADAAVDSVLAAAR
jgi:AcrR family transcriptional regulator